MTVDADQWNCPWPPAADASDIDEAVAVVRVLVAADGTVEGVRMLRDPGLGFAHAASQCAHHARFHPATDDLGKPVRSWSAPIKVLFTR